jgi:hypothetical protein
MIEILPHNFEKMRLGKASSYCFNKKKYFHKFPWFDNIRVLACSAIYVLLTAYRVNVRLHMRRLKRKNNHHPVACPEASRVACPEASRVACPEASRVACPEDFLVPCLGVLLEILT